VFTRHDLVAAGRSETEVRRRVRRGEWVRLRHGVYVDAQRLEHARTDESVHHRLLAAAVLRATRTPHAVITGRSAALVHGLPLLHPAPDLVEVSVPRSARGSITGVRERTTRSAWHVDDVSFVQGIRVVSAARAVLDVALASSRREAAVVVDAALRSGVVMPDALTASAGRLTGVVPHRELDIVRLLTSQGDPSIADPLLSVARRDALDHGLPAPSGVDVHLPRVGAAAPALQWSGNRDVVLVLERDAHAARPLRALGATVLIASEHDVLHRSDVVIAQLNGLLRAASRRVAA
jgi:hypothetical protein